MRRFLVSLAMALALALPAATALAAEGDTVLTGRVTNEEDGSGVANATVSIESLNLSATTDRSGRYTLAVPSGLARGRPSRCGSWAPRSSRRPRP